MTSTGAVSVLHSTPNPGPLARLAEITAQPGTMDEIAMRIIDGASLKDIAKAWEVPFGKLFLWIASDDQRKALYWEAKAFGSDAGVDDAQKIADDAEPAEVPKARIRIDIRKWRAERLFKDRYAPRTEQTGPQGVPLNAEDPIEIARRMLFVMRLADKANEKVVSEIPPIAAPAAIVAPTPDEQLI